MLVYRLEDNTNHGPWNNTSNAGREWCPRWIPEFETGISYYRDLPTPWEDGITMPQQIGVKSPREFVKWFPRKVRQAAAKHGFVCRVLDVPTYEEGGHQVSFNRTEAQVVKEIPLRRAVP